MAKNNLAGSLAALEAEVAQLKAKLSNAPPRPGPWWKQIWGVFDDAPAFDEAMRLGREYANRSVPYFSSAGNRTRRILIHEEDEEGLKEATNHGQE